MHHSGIAQSSKHAETFTDGTVSPWVFFAKSSDCESSNRFVHPCNEPSILQSKNKKALLPWLPKTELLKLDSQDLRFAKQCPRSFSAHKWREFPGKFSTFKKNMHVTILSKVD
jgi:hypothetical protein